jgi:hypothetical protein
MLQSVVSSEVCVEDTSLHTTLQLLHCDHGPCQELSAYWHILRMCSCPFEAQTYKAATTRKEEHLTVGAVHWK